MAMFLPTKTQEVKFVLRKLISLAILRHKSSERGGNKKHFLKTATLILAVERVADSHVERSDILWWFI